MRNVRHDLGFSLERFRGTSVQHYERSGVRDRHSNRSRPTSDALVTTGFLRKPLLQKCSHSFYFVIFRAENWAQLSARASRSFSCSCSTAAHGSSPQEIHDVAEE